MVSGSIAMSQVNDTMIDSLVARKSIKEKVSLKLSTFNSSEWFEVAGSNGSPGTELRPNGAVVNRFGFNYRFLSLGYKFLISSLPPNSDDDEKGETKSNGLHFAVSPGQWATDFSWDKTKGYYLHNTDDFDLTWSEGDPYIQIPDLESQIFRLRVGRVLNPEYSINAVALQTEQQLKSQGSLLPGLRLTYYSVDNKTPLGGTVNSSQKSNQFEGIFSLGYIYTLVLGKGFYTSVDLRPGMGFLNSQLLTRFANSDDIESSENHLVTGFDTDLQIGFDRPGFFAGLKGSYDHYEHNQGNTQAARITNERFRFEFFFGIRIKAPEKLKQRMDAAESELIKQMIKRKQKRAQQGKG